MKKVIALALAAVLALSLAACGGTNSESQTNSTGTSASGSTAQTGVDLSGDPIAFLEGKKVGVQQGTTGDTFASDLDCQVMQFTKYADAVTALEQGKVDAIVIDQQPAQAFINQKDNLAVFETQLTQDEFAIAVKKGNTQLAEQFNQAIAEIKADGTMDAILDKYINGTEGAQGYVTPEGTQYPNGKLIMATNATYPPYEYLQGEEVVGIDPEVAKAICDKLGYELVIQDMEFDAILAAVNSGKADFGAAGLTITEERQKNVDFTDTYSQGILVCMVKE